MPLTGGQEPLIHTTLCPSLEGRSPYTDSAVPLVAHNTMRTCGEIDDNKVVAADPRGRATSTEVRIAVRVATLVTGKTMAVDVTAAGDSVG